MLDRQVEDEPGAFLPLLAQLEFTAEVESWISSAGAISSHPSVRKTSRTVLMDPASFTA